MAVKVFIPPAMMIFLSFFSIRHKIIHPIRKYINALINLIKFHAQKIKLENFNSQGLIEIFKKFPIQISARQRLAMRSTRFNSFCDIVESLIHISPLWLRGFGYHQSLLLTKFIQLTNSDFDEIGKFVTVRLPAAVDLKEVRIYLIGYNSQQDLSL